MDGRVVILAGRGHLPTQFAEEATMEGLEVVVVGLTPDVDAELAKHAKEIRCLSIGRWQEVIDALHDSGAKELCLLGKVDKRLLFSGTAMDSRFQRVLASVSQRNDESMIKAFVKDLECEGFVICEQYRLSPRSLVRAEALSRRRPTAQEWEDIALGYELAKGIARLDIGQTVVVKAGMVLAVEAIEGTDECILRGGSLGQGDVVVVKVAKPKQDPRFDMPTVGVGTIEAMAEAGARVLACEAGLTLLIDRQETIATADRHSIALLGYESGS